MSIEERAKQWSQHYCTKGRRDITCIAYEVGAKEMLEKAVKWLNDNKVRDDIVGYFLDTQREEMREEFIEEFKKAMEE